MSEQPTNEDILRKKMEMEEKITETIDTTITDVFKDRPQEEVDFHKETAYRVYQLDVENEELRHQLYYSSSVCDAITTLLLSKGILNEVELKQTMETIHNKAMADFEKSQEFVQNEVQNKSTETSIAEI